MPVSQANADLLLQHGITLKKELKASSVIQLYNSNEDLRISKNLYDKLLYAIGHASNNELHLPKIYFGIEFEFVGSALQNDLTKFNLDMYKLLGTSFFSCINSYQHNDGKFWLLGRDGSIHWPDSQLEHPYGYELSSPKLELFNQDDIDTVSNVINLIKSDLRGEVNKTCGTHVHIGFDCKGASREELQKLLYSYSNIENKVFDPIVPGSRRRNRYCGRTVSNTHSKYQKLSARYCEFDMFTKNCNNVHLESRQLEGTLDFLTIYNWAILQASVLYDMFNIITSRSVSFNDYSASLVNKNIFDILFEYNFTKELRNFFIERAVKLKSRCI